MTTTARARCHVNGSTTTTRAVAVRATVWCVLETGCSGRSTLEQAGWIRRGLLYA